MRRYREFDVVVLGVPAQDLERSVAVKAVPLHEETLGLTDELAVSSAVLSPA